MNVDSIGKTVQVIAVVVGVVISILSFNQTREKEAEARRLEAQKPYLELRQKLYVEAVKSAGVLSNPDGHTKDELRIAKQRFRELYVTELSMVEAPEVALQMHTLAETIDPDLTKFTRAQSAAYDLSHALRDSFVLDWRIETDQSAKK